MALGKLTNEEQKRISELVDAIRKEQGKLADALCEFNNKKSEIFSEIVEPAKESFNAVVEQARAYIEDIVTDQNARFDDRSESWQESEKGLAVRDWIDTMENISFEESDVDEPESADEDVPADCADELDNLSPEAES